MSYIKYINYSIKSISLYLLAGDTFSIKEIQLMLLMRTQHNK